MKRREVIIATIGGLAALLVVILLIRHLFFPAQNPAPGATSSPESLFPTGETRGGINPNNLAPLGVATTIDRNNPETADPGITASDLTGRFVRLTSKPVGGAVLLGQGTSTVLLYADRATGHLFRFNPASRITERVTNTTIPKVYQLWGGQSGTSTYLVFQSLKDNQFQTFSGRLVLPNPTAGEAFLTGDENLATLTGQILVPALTDLAVAPPQNEFFQLQTSGGLTTGYLTSLASGKTTPLWSSPLADWQVSWVASSTIALQTKPAAQYPGALYFLDVKTKKLKTIISAVPGLSALVSPRLDQVLYSGATSRGLVTGLYQIKRQIFTRLNLQTWADKCAWTASGSKLFCAVPTSLDPNLDYPDAWYRGETTATDNLWQIEAQTGQAEIIFNPTLAKSNFPLDAERLIITADENTLFLINRRDHNLWALNLRGEF